MSKIKIPKEGQQMYVPSQYYVYRGEEDISGGIATINKVEINKDLPIEHINAIMVGFQFNQRTLFNYKSLMQEQPKLKKMYGNKIAKLDPDFRPEFNDENADWH